MGSIRRLKTKRMTRGLDQVHADRRSSSHLSRHKDVKPAEDLPGLGRFYCVDCAKWFEGEHSLVQHRRGKNHKRRCKLLKEVPFSQKEADAATGLGVEEFVSLRTSLPGDAGGDELKIDDTTMELEIGGNATGGARGNVLNVVQ